MLSGAFAQKQPQVYRAYWDNDDPFIINHLILGSDGVFFQFSSCECGKEYYAQGTYQIKGNKLYLQGFDSTKAFPKSRIKFIKGEPIGDSVTIRTSDYFGQPLTNLLLGLVNKDSTINPFYEFVDNHGQYKFSRKDYIGFFLIFEAKDGTGLVQKSSIYHFVDKGIKEALVHIDFVAAGFDREPIPFNIGRMEFNMRNGNLYGKGNTPVYVTNPHW